MTEKPAPPPAETELPQVIRSRNAKIASLRERSGLSMDELAKLMGFKGSSSIQRYLSPTYDKGFRPELAAKFRAALVGLGDPPIDAHDLSIFDRFVETPTGEIIDYSDISRQIIAEIIGSADRALTPDERAEFFERRLARLHELGIPDRSHISAALTQARRARFLDVDEDHKVVGLPLAEGDVVFKIPKHLSAESVETLRDWLDHIIGLSTAGSPK